MSAELFIYWRTPTPSLAAAQAAVQALHRDLRHKHAGLVARLYLRQHDIDTGRTLMETYAHPAGIGLPLQAAIAKASAEALAPWCLGARHLEAFVAVPEVDTPRVHHP